MTTHLTKALVGALVLAASGLLAQSAAAAPPRSVGVGDVPGLQGYLQRTYPDIQNLGELEVRVVDLDSPSDGVEEIILGLTTKGYCGASACAYDLLRREESGGLSAIASLLAGGIEVTEEATGGVRLVYAVHGIERLPVEVRGETSGAFDRVVDPGDRIDDGPAPDSGGDAYKMPPPQDDVAGLDDRDFGEDDAAAPGGGQDSGLPGRPQQIPIPPSGGGGSADADQGLQTAYRETPTVAGPCRRSQQWIGGPLDPGGEDEGGVSLFSGCNDAKYVAEFSCSRRDPARLTVRLSAVPVGHKIGDDAQGLVVVDDGKFYPMLGKVKSDPLQGAITEFQTDRFDGMLEALQRGSFASVSAGGLALPVHLVGSRKAIDAMLAACGAY